MKCVSDILTVRELDTEKYKGRVCEFAYQTSGFYEFIRKENSFQLEYREFAQPVKKSFTDELIGEWLEAPCLYGAFWGEEEAGFAEGSMESWNNRFRISNLLVFEEYRQQGIGKALMRKILSRAAEEGARMAVLETQSCNVNAIRFYRSCGFEIIGFDLYSYSNHDPEQQEVRIEMGIFLKEQESPEK